jgi:hypothetical protein
VARHPFDPVSFVLGGVAVASGAVVLADRSLTDDARVLLPAGLIALGIALFTKVVRSDGRPIPADPAPVPPPFSSAVDLPGPGRTFRDEDPSPDPPRTDPTVDDPLPEDAPWPAAGDGPDVPAPPDSAPATEGAPEPTGGGTHTPVGGTASEGPETPDDDRDAVDRDGPAAP